MNDTYDDYPELEDEDFLSNGVFEDEDYEDAYDDYADDEVDEMLEGIESVGENDDELTERRRRRRSKRRRRRRRPVRTAKGRSAFRGGGRAKHVTQSQLKSTMARVGKDVRRNAKGIKTLSRRLKVLDDRVDGVVAVNRVQSKKIGALEHRLKLDGALDVARALRFESDGRTASLAPDLGLLAKGALKMGLVGGETGVLSNPAVVAGLGFLLANPAIIRGLVGGASAAGVGYAADASTSL